MKLITPQWPLPSGVAACSSTRHGGVSEGIYSSHLTQWRVQREREGIAGLEPKKSGRKPMKDAKDIAIEKLEREKAKLEHRLRVANALLDLQKKAHEILGVALPGIEDE